MHKSYKIYTPTSLTKFLDQVNIYLYICGFPDDLWVSPPKLPQIFTKIYDKLIIFNHVFLIAVLATTYASFETQKDQDLSIDQKTDRMSIAVSMVFIHFYYYTFIYYKVEVRDVLYDLFVVLKENYCDPEVVEAMIKRIKLYMGVLSVFALLTVLFRGVNGVIRLIFFGEAFNPCITGWPPMDAKHTPAGTLVRVMHYIGLCSYTFRVIGTCTFAALLLISVSFQFRNLASYFKSLNAIFDDNNLTLKEQERKYEKEFINGIYGHICTLRCVQNVQYVGRPIFSAQLLLTLTHLTLILPDFVDSKDDLVHLVQQLPMLGVILVVLAYFMINAGDITEEASELASAMYSSGWYNCRDNIVAVRKLLANSILMAQQPVVLKAFDIVEMSYENYVTIVKTSYSVFSVFS